MKSFDRGSTLENLLFPHKIRPYQQKGDCEEMSKSKHEGILGQKSFHILELTEPQHLLDKIFLPYARVVKILGCQPSKMKDGVSHFSYFSWNTAYSLMVFGVFLGDTAYFLPILKHMNSEQSKNIVVYVTEIILVVSQIFAALMSYVFIAMKAKNLVQLWNRLQAVLVRLVARCPNHLDLIPAYRSARMKIAVWLMFTVVFGSCYITSFQDEIWSYLKENGYNRIFSWFLFSGFAFYSGLLLSIHILHSTCFTTYVCVFGSCFDKLGAIAMKQDGQGSIKSAQSPVLFQDIIEIYDELLALKCLLGSNYGIYLALEILTMIICVTINFFFMISKPENTSLFLLNMAIVMPYLIWFHGICRCGGYLNCSMRRCHKNIRNAITNAGRKQFINDAPYVLVQVETPPNCLSAGGYFVIDLKLFTAVMGTIATYLVVMLQFGTGMKNGIGVISQLSSINKNATTVD